jgi:hypothetical protein
MNHRFAGTCVLAFLLCGASPAFALTRHAAFGWAPASGPVVGYAVYASIGDSVEELVATVAGPSAIVEVESSHFVSVRVAAYDSAGRLGPLSDPSYPVRLCPGDFDGDEITGPSDKFDVRNCLGQFAEGFCAGADLDLDGSIGVSDWNQAIVGADACALANQQAACPGDHNGDDVIGTSDVALVLSCLDQQALGACAPADFNDDGTITLGEVNFVVRAVGATGCSS